MTDDEQSAWVLAQARKQLRAGILFQQLDRPRGLNLRATQIKKYELGNFVVRVSCFRSQVYVVIDPRYRLKFLSADDVYVWVGFPTVVAAKWAMKHNNWEESELKDDFTGKIL